ncbi:MAG: ATP-binding protein [Geobacteraceae bacterium]|nr:ATP-binding protein [Geobacteraceae bacterium]
MNWGKPGLSTAYQENMDIDELTLPGNGAKGDKLKQLAEHLRLFEDRFRNIISGITDGFIIVDMDGIVRIVNPVAAVLFNRKPEELAGRELGLPLAEGESIEHHIDCGAQGTRIAEFRTVRTQWEGQPFFLVSLRDITARKHMEEQLKKKQLQLEELNRTLEQRVREEVEKNREKEHLLILQNRQAAMGEMIGNIAHQWRQPLTSISLLIQDLGECFDFGELNREYLDSTISNAMNIIQHMSQTIDDFRNFFKQEKEHMAYRVNQVISRSLSFMETSLRYANVNVHMDTDEDIVLTGFPNELSQVLLNIFGNAKDIFLERKTVNPELRIKTSREGEKTVITISDNGGGIHEDIIGRIFEPYFSHRKKQGGTGIGLYMAKTIIEKNMGGRLSAENIEGGASFRIEI